MKQSSGPRKRRSGFASKYPGLIPVVNQGLWYRAVRPQDLTNPLTTVHTATISSRFSSGSLGHPQYEILYLTENPLVALFEVQALLGSWQGVNVPNPNVFMSILTVQVSLQRVVDLTAGAAIQTVGTTVQELTGDWKGYALRNPVPPANSPYFSDVPTRRLGFDLNESHIEGFIVYSARVPDRKNLVVLPNNLDPNSSVSCNDPSGVVIQRIP